MKDTWGEGTGTMVNDRLLFAFVSLKRSQPFITVLKHHDVYEHEQEIILRDVLSFLK